MDTAGEFSADLAVTAQKLRTVRGGGTLPLGMSKTQKDKQKKQWRLSDPMEKLSAGLDKLSTVCDEKMAGKGTKQKTKVPYPCWICSNNVEEKTQALGCEKCDAWAHAKCVGVTDKFLDIIANGKGICFDTYCDSCRTNENMQMMEELKEIKHKLETHGDVMQNCLAAQNDVILRLTGNIDLLKNEMKQMTTEMKQIKDENKELKKICSDLRDDNKNAKSKTPATNAQTLSYASTAKNALITTAAESESIMLGSHLND